MNVVATCIRFLRPSLARLSCRGVSSRSSRLRVEWEPSLRRSALPSRPLPDAASAPVLQAQCPCTGMHATRGFGPPVCRGLRGRFRKGLSAGEVALFASCLKADSSHQNAETHHLCCSRAEKRGVRACLLVHARERTLACTSCAAMYGQPAGNALHEEEEEQEQEERHSLCSCFTSTLVANLT